MVKVRAPCAVCHKAIDEKSPKRYGSVVMHRECDKLPTPCDICDLPVDELKPRRIGIKKRHKECHMRPQPCVYCKEMVVSDRMNISRDGTQAHIKCHTEKVAMPLLLSLIRSAAAQPDVA